MSLKGRGFRPRHDWLKRTWGFSPEGLAFQVGNLPAGTSHAVLAAFSAKTFFLQAAHPIAFFPQRSVSRAGSGVRTKVHFRLEMESSLLQFSTTDAAPKSCLGLRFPLPDRARPVALQGPIEYAIRTVRGVPK